MIRDALTQVAYWDEWIEFDRLAISKRAELAVQNSSDRAYDAQYVRDLAFMNMRLMLRCYSRGDSMVEVSRHFEPIVYYWEESERLGHGVWTEEQKQKRYGWSVNLDYYIECFWLVGLALALDVPDSQWQRLLALMGNEGEDALLDRIIATRDKDRIIGASLCYPRPYQQLFSCIDASQEIQSLQLEKFVERWYSDLNTAVRFGRKKQGYPIGRPCWHEYHTPMKGAYFGYWCIEAMVVAKVFGINDRLCIGHPNYPGDFLRSDAVTAPDVQRLPSELVAVATDESDQLVVAAPRSVSAWEAIKSIVRNKLRP